MHNMISTHNKKTIQRCNLDINVQSISESFVVYGLKMESSVLLFHHKIDVLYDKFLDKSKQKDDMTLYYDMMKTIDNKILDYTEEFFVNIDSIKNEMDENLKNKLNSLESILKDIKQQKLDGDPYLVNDVHKYNICSQENDVYIEEKIHIIEKFFNDFIWNIVKIYKEDGVNIMNPYFKNVKKIKQQNILKFKEKIYLK